MIFGRGRGRGSRDTSRVAGAAATATAERARAAASVQARHDVEGPAGAEAQGRSRLAWLARRATGRPTVPVTAPSHDVPSDTRAPAIPPDVLRQVKFIELRTRGLVNSLFAGEYRSVFKGQGMEFAEVREYQPGDEVRTIDWNVTARMRRPYVRRYEEERELTVMLAVDLSGSSRFGTHRRFKSELETELAAVLALSAVRNNDRVGAVLFSDRIEHVVPPRKGRRHALRLLRDVLAYAPKGTGTDIGGAVEYLSKLLTHKSIVFLISDFQSPDLERPLKRLALRHDVVAIAVEDPTERALPNVGLARFLDPETGVAVDVDTSDTRVRAAFDGAVSTQAEERRRLLRRLAIDEVPVQTDRGYVEPLLRFFRSRETRARRA